jgi:hypothetical protein
MKINFYGCSFSDGGGMDRWDWFQGIKDEDWVNPMLRKRILKQGHNRKGFSDLLYMFKDLHKFSTLVCKEFNCDLGDYAYTANNNQNIRDEVWNNIREDDGKIHIVQWSIPERRKLWYEKTEKFYRMQSNLDKPNAFEENTEVSLQSDTLQSIQYHYLKHCFNMEYEMQKLKMYTELLHTFAYDKGHQIYFMFHDIPDGIVVEPSANHITFDGMEVGRWINKNELTIQAESKGLVNNDRHYSREGNILIANKIIETLRADKVIDKGKYS